MGEPQGITVRFSGPYNSWTFNFAAPEGEELNVGTYRDATRYPFHDSNVPGLSVSGEGRGCNSVTGSFVVHELAYGDHNEIATLAIDFVQHCEELEPALRGALRYNSEIPRDYSALVAVAGPDQSVASQSVVALDGTRSSAPSGESLTYEWVQISGSAIELQTAQSPQPLFEAPRVHWKSSAETLEFELRVTAENGSSATDTVSITVQPESGPPGRNK